MKGHQQLIDMRLRGRLPLSLYIGVDEVWPRWFTSDWTTETCHGSGVHAHVLVEPEDLIDRLDLRFVVGMTVQVSGDEDARVKAVGMRCLEEGASRVVTFVGEEVNDSEGAWPR